MKIVGRRVAKPWADAYITQTVGNILQTQLVFKCKMTNAFSKRRCAAAADLDAPRDP